MAYVREPQLSFLSRSMTAIFSLNFEAMRKLVWNKSVRNSCYATSAIQYLIAVGIHPQACAGTDDKT
nr:hypothetical protein [Parasutterella excrementihominis]